MGFFGSLLKGIGKGLAGAASLIPGVGSFVSDGLNSIIGDAERSDAISQQTSLNKEMMTYQHDLNRADWEAQNAYNTPLAQMQRITDAGINPLTQSFTGFQASLPSAVSSQSAPDVSSLLNYQLALRQFNQQSALTNQEIKAKKIENKVAAEEGKARIAEAKEREADANARKIFGDTRDQDAYQAYVDEFNTTPPDNEHDWKFSTRDDSDFGYWYYTDDDGKIIYHVGVPNLWGLDRRTQRLFTDYNNQKAQLQAQKIQNAYSQFQEQLYRKFGDKIERAKLNQINAMIRNLILTGDLQKIDVDTFKKLGLGPNVIRALVSTAQAFGGQLNGMIGAAEMIMK